MKKLLRHTLKATSWVVLSCLTTILISGVTIQDMVFTLGYACMMSPLIAAVSLGLIPIYVAHEYVWGDAK